MAPQEISRLQDTSGSEEVAPPCLFVIVGATGDLAGRKIAPALYNLFHEGKLNERTAVLGVARRPRSDEQFRQEMLDAIRKYSRSGIDEKTWAGFASRWHYSIVDNASLDSYRELADKIARLDQQYDLAGNRVFYLAILPEAFPDVVRNLGGAGLSRPRRDDGFSRVVVEKPFGVDRGSARDLNTTLLEHFTEEQVYRIDHYLGKETVQNLVALRFANAIFEPLFNRQYVDHVQITTAESAGMEGRRGAYYEESGALRDMVQSHMLQMLALTAMEVPPRIDAAAIRNEKVKVLQCISPLTPEQVARQTIRGQYVTGPAGKGYCEEEGVAPDSQTETYVAATFFVDNWRWAGVPFHLRTGKRLSSKTSHIVITFRREPMSLFYDMCCDIRGPNQLMVRIFPTEGVSITIDGKVPGPGMLLRPVRMDFDYGTNFGSASPEAYEHLLLDAIQGDSTLFIRDDEVEASWRIIDSIRSSWNTAGMPKLVMYPAGSAGPEEAQQLLGDPYKRWHPI